ncbi:MAG TPA: VWA domain-containing protein, partial [Candidatus Berkiella sp.]|nr:VWA domain-containing protein [Candidatus Berkiella sp.]
QKVVQSLQEIFSSPQATREGFNYSLREIFETKNLDGIELTSPNIDFQSTSATGVLSKIFSEEVLVDCGLTKNALLKFDNSIDKTLRIPISSGIGFEKLWKSRLQILTSAMIGVGINGMRNAYLNDNCFVEFNTALTNLELAKEFQSTIGIVNYQESLHFVLNYQALLKLLFPQPPALQVDTLPSGTWKISFQKQESIHYLFRTFQEGFILTQEHDQFIPVFLPKGNLAKPKNLLSLILDCSGSMQDVFPQYIKHVKSLLALILEKSSSDDIIRIVDFASISNTREFKLTANKTRDQQEIEEHLESLTADGVTRLYDTTLEELAVLQQYVEYVESVVIFTDGFDNLGTKANEDTSAFEQRTNQFLMDYDSCMQETAHRAPSVFTMGLGDSYNQKLLETWAKRSGVEHTHLQSIDDFSNILTHLEKLRRPRILVRFMQDTFEHFQSVYEGTLSISNDIKIKPDESFTVGDKEYRLEPVLNKQKIYTPSYTSYGGYSGSEPEYNSSSEEEVEDLTQRTSRLSLCTLF